MDQQEAARSWQQEKSQYFIDELNKKVWSKDTQLDILVLHEDCPVCEHPDGIDVTVPTTITRFRGAEQQRSQFVECRCAEKHNGRPDGQLGCGRWGMVTIKEAEG
jgi:hypothetical protein